MIAQLMTKTGVAEATLPLDMVRNRDSSEAYMMLLSLTEQSW